MSKTLIKPTKPSSSSSVKKALDSYFVPDAGKAKVLNQSEPKTESRFLKKPELQTLKSKVGRNHNLRF